MITDWGHKSLVLRCEAVRKTSEAFFLLGKISVGHKRNEGISVKNAFLHSSLSAIKDLAASRSSLISPGPT